MASVFKILFFYVALITLVSLYGYSTLDQELLFPEVSPVNQGTNSTGFELITGSTSAGTDLQEVEENLISTAIRNVTLIFRVIFLSFTDLFPAWLNTIVFLPLTLFMIYEVVARLVRGS